MRQLFFFLFFFASSVAYSQDLVLADTVVIGKSVVAVLKKDGTGFTVSSPDGSKQFLTIKENYYRFADGSVAHPDVTVRSIQNTMDVILSNNLFDSNGLNETAVKNFVSKYRVPMPVQQLYRDSRVELNPEIR